MEITEQFKKEIAPFAWVELPDSGNVAIYLYAGEYLQELFDTRADEGFQGSGYDWESLAQVFFDEKCPDLQEKINFDSEADTFCLFSHDKEALADFILQFKRACEDKALISDLFSRAELE